MNAERVYNQIEITPDVWIISDTHFFHRNIVKYCDRPADHDNQIVVNWNKRIADDDIVLHLGDVFMGAPAPARALLAQLPGDKYMIRGNHDTKTSQWFEEVGFKTVNRRLIYMDDRGRKVIFSHDPIKPESYDGRWDINVHGHIHNNGYPVYAISDKDYRNVSVEVMDYKPVRLRDILYGDSYESQAEAGINPYQFDYGASL